MNKKLKKIVSALLLGATLGLAGVISTPATTASAINYVYSQNDLSVQTIYRENGYIIAKVNASQEALDLGVEMDTWGESKSDIKVFNAGNTVGTTMDDECEITVERNGAAYYVTFKVPVDAFWTTWENGGLTADFYAGYDLRYDTEAPIFQDNNGGHLYSI